MAAGSASNVTDHSNMLGTLDTTDDTPRAAILDLARSKAKLGSPRITPFMVDGDQNGGTSTSAARVSSVITSKTRRSCRQADRESRCA